MEETDKGERVEEPSSGVRRSLNRACNETPAVVSVVVVEVARGTEVVEAFIFVARRHFILSPTREIRSSSAEECEAIERVKVAEREVADCVTAIYLCCLTGSGSSYQGSGVSAREQGAARSLYRDRQTRNRGGRRFGRDGCARKTWKA